MRDQFLVEVGDGEKVAGLAEMNRLFRAWLETAYHQAVHSETGEAPAARWEKATPEERAVPEPALLREAFLWSERRKADKTALVRLHGNACQVDAWLAGRVVELLFDPFDLDRIEVRPAGSPPGPRSRPCRRSLRIITQVDGSSRPGRRRHQSPVVAPWPPVASRPPLVWRGARQTGPARPARPRADLYG